MTQSAISAFWGKSDRAIPSRTHPLLAHSADVAAVMEKLLQLPIYRKVYSALSGRNLDRCTLARFAICAGLHDAGKNTAGFQAKNHNKAESRTHGHIYPMGALCDPSFLKEFLDIFPWLEEWGESIYDYLVCIFAHHGSFPKIIREAGLNPALAKQCSDLWRPRLPSGFSSFDGLKILAQYFPLWFPDAFSKGAPLLPGKFVLQHFFSGLLMLADWIGSDESFFPYVSSDSFPDDYMETARSRASEALAIMRLDTSVIRSNVSFPHSFHEQFQLQPLPAQQAMDVLPIPDAGRGSLTIIEAETGSGKTECALRFFVRLFETGHVDSLYFANPLRFAATQLQKRVTRHFSSLFGEDSMPTVLAVPGYLTVDERQGIRLPGFSVLWPDDGKDARRNWAAEYPKRYLCAPCAVGTIDQALLSVLKTPHAHLRAVSLCRSLLVIDEVHASDAFMTRITESLIALFAHCGGHVLMMSATLGGAVRKRYLDTFASKKVGSHSVPTLGSCVNAPYPLISSTVQTGETPLTSMRTKEVALSMLPLMTSPDAVASYALDAAKCGACVLVLRNSVSLAIETLRELEKVSTGKEDLLFTVCGAIAPHHARFAPIDRQLLDEGVEQMFGKSGTRRAPCVIVTTQTLEQSLDVDFDLLITDLCPADVLLQRIGRLFRHDRGRPQAFSSPKCCILVPDSLEKNWLLTKEAQRCQFGQERAYEDIRSVAATWFLMESILRNDHGILAIPERNRWFVENATHPEALGGLAERLSPSWTEVTVKVTGTKGAKRTQAAYDTLDWEKEFEESDCTLDDRAVTTRLGLKDAVVHFAPALLGPFGCVIDRMSIPGWMVQGEDFSELDEPIRAEPMDGGFTFSIFGKSFRYGRYGLERS